MGSLPPGHAHEGPDHRCCSGIARYEGVAADEGVDEELRGLRVVVVGVGWPLLAHIWSATLLSHYHHITHMY